MWYGEIRMWVHASGMQEKLQSPVVMLQKSIWEKRKTQEIFSNTEDVFINLFSYTSFFNYFINILLNIYSSYVKYFFVLQLTDVYTWASYSTLDDEYCFKFII